MFNLWRKISLYISEMTAGLFIAVCFVLILCTVVFCVLKVKKLNATAAIIISSVLCSIFTIPLIISLNAFVESKTEEGEYISRAQMDAEINGLREEIELLKSAELSMQSMNRICEVALLETALKQIDVQKEPLNVRQGKGVFADTITEESLVIQAHDVNAKFGVDLRKVKAYEKDNTLYISGIRSKYIGSDKNITTHILSEIRKIETKGSMTTTTIFNSSADKELAHQKANAAEKMFQERLSKGLGVTFMDDAVVKLAQNFIIAILSPLQKQIVFVQEERGQPILDFLRSEIDEKSSLLKAMGY